MKDLSYYRAIQNTLTLTSKKDATTKLLQRNLDNDFRNSIDYDEVTFNYRTKKIKQELTITVEKNKDEFEIKSLCSETFNLGEVFTWQGNCYLITKISLDKRLRTSGTIKRCNYLLRWQNNAGEIVERWAVTQDASSYSTGVEEKNVIGIGSDQLMIYVPCDDETVVVKREKRFFVSSNKENPIVYRLTRPDTTTYTVNGVGYCAWIVSEDQYNPQTDNIDLMLCDYKTAILPSEPVEISYNGNAEIRCGGNAKTFTANTDLVLQWGLELTSVQEDKVTLTVVENNKVKVKCVSDESLIGSSFKLTCATPDAVFSKLLITIIGGV